MTKTDDLMIDLETLGTSGTPAIAQIGACYFDRDTGAIYKSFKVNIDMETMPKLGFDIDIATVLWWMKQPIEARELVFFNNDKVEPVEAFRQFCCFAKEAKNVWSHASFDFPKLEGAFTLLGLNFPFHFRTARDMRTAIDSARMSKDEAASFSYGTYHDALDDCRRQVKILTECFRRINYRG